MSEGQKTAVIFGLANKRSIAWAIAQKLNEAGWRLAITYQNERLEQEAKDLITDLPGADGFMCDVTSDAEIAKLFEQLKARYGVLDGLVHSVAFAPADDMKGEFLNTTREGFRIAHDVSVYSLIAVARAAAPLMTNGGSIVTLTYYGAEKVVPKYNVMGVAKAALEATVRYLANDLGPKGIRVNAISAGPIKTLAARGVSQLGRDAEVACGTFAAEAECGSGRSWRHGGVFVVAGGFRNYRRNTVRRLRLQHHGFLVVCPAVHVEEEHRLTLGVHCD